VGVPCGVTISGAGLISSGISLRCLVGIDARVFQWGSWSKWLSPWVSFNLSKTTMKGLRMPSWFSSAGLAWNLSSQLWVGIALVGD